ncbi:MAG: PHP domain-containing protein [Clostridia bacterium]|nr:PHP domain-containing protein [Clostridia bacterium]
MGIVADLHIHTLVSHHAYSSLRENIEQAKAKGLVAIAITDHVYGAPDSGNTWHFGNMVIWPREMEGLLVLRGAEANIIDMCGSIDLAENDQRVLDIVIASLHPYCVKPTDRRAHTQAMAMAVQNPCVRILGHPASVYYEFDEEEIVRQCVYTGTLLEINEHAMKKTPQIAAINERLLKLCMRYRAQIVVSSDAHICYEVGCFSLSHTLLKHIAFPEELVINGSQERVMEMIQASEQED